MPQHIEITKTLCRLAKLGETDSIKSFSKEGVDVNELLTCSVGFGPAGKVLGVFNALALAIIYGHIDTVKLLMEGYKADPNILVGKKKEYTVLDCLDHSFRGISINSKTKEKIRTYLKQHGAKLNAQLLGYQYEIGRGVEQDLLKAVNYYQKEVDKGFITVQEDIDRIFNDINTSAAYLHNIGAMYCDGSIKGIKQNYVEALRWYEKAKNKGCALSYSNIGDLYKSGNGVTKNLKTAVQYYEQAIKDRCTTVNPQKYIDDIFGDVNTSAHDLDQIGVMYTNADGVTRDYKKGLEWLTKAAEKGSAAAHRNIGTLYNLGLGGVEKNLVTAVKYYQQAIEKGYTKAQEDIDDIFKIPDITPVDVNSIACMYYNATDCKQDYQKALKWFEKSKDEGYGIAYRNIGLFHEYGRVVVKNIITAVKYYQQAIDQGYSEAKEDIIRIYNDINTTAHDLDQIGVMYTNADGVTRDYKKGLEWLTKAAEKGSIVSHSNMGIVYSCGGYGVTQNLYKAKEHYTEVRKYYEKNYKINKTDNRKQLKAIERTIIENAINTERLDELDEENRTALHRAAQYKFLKNYAVLKNFGAETNILDSVHKKPLNYLTAANLKKVNRLQNFLTTNSYHTTINTTAAEVIASRTFVKNAKLDSKNTIKTLTELYDMPDIKPLLDLAKLAMVGRHKLSGRPAVLNDSYDSDDEEEPDAIQKLKIIIDPDKDTVEQIACFGEDGNGGKKALGVYIPDEPNTLYIAGDREKHLVKGTMIHELCHFLAQEVFDNNCSPYAVSDTVNKDKFTKIAESMEKRKTSLDPLFKTVFDSYPKAQYHGELIVRVAQFIVITLGGVIALQRKEPDLLHYYQTVFLENIKNHRKKLEQKAIGIGWSLSLFKQSKGEDYQLDTEKRKVDDEEFKAKRSRWGYEEYFV